MQQLRTVRLYGVLGSRFGRVFRLAVNTPAEAVRALCVQIPGFEAHMMRDRRYRYAVFCGKRNLSEDELQTAGGAEDIRIAPVIAGSKNSGLVSAVLGAVLVVAGFFTGGAAWAGAAMLGKGMMFAGAGLLIGGVAQMLVPQPEGLSDSSQANNKPSYAFGGPVNTVAQGRPVGLLYGERMVGGAIVSAGIYAEDQM
ncbi:MAG: phage tail protein [Alcanivorax sp.]|nr:phage tail protein [Alcanivorax sp.]MAY11900.1 phage tail protein [Alcanivorax sp.]MBI56784.1 phage tail protein [Alcanivorax sp.]MBM1145651.1 tail assembly protein [Alcanivorax sp. ZXX171]|tara:strand:- start:37 stop:627 length:591 start_codon:yes stop_codon:yes gene_type:complete